MVPNNIVNDVPSPTLSVRLIVLQHFLLLPLSRHPATEASPHPLLNRHQASKALSLPHPALLLYRIITAAAAIMSPRH